MTIPVVLAIDAVSQKGLAVLTLSIELLEKMGEKLIELAERGSKVSNAFQALTTDISGAQRALHGSVTALELAQLANRATVAGLRLTSDEFATITEFAKRAAKATGGDFRSSAESILQALATGRTRALKSFGIDIDASGTKAQVASRAIGNMRERVEQMGHSSATVGGKMHELDVAWEDFVDVVARSIAESQSLLGLFHEMEPALHALRVAAPLVGRAIAAGITVAVHQFEQLIAKIQDALHWLGEVSNWMATHGRLINFIANPTGGALGAIVQAGTEAVVGNDGLDRALNRADQRISGVGQTLAGLYAQAEREYRVNEEAGNLGGAQLDTIRQIQRQHGFGIASNRGGGGGGGGRGREPPSDMTFTEEEAQAAFASLEKYGVPNQDQIDEARRRFAELEDAREDALRRRQETADEYMRTLAKEIDAEADAHRKRFLTAKERSAMDQVEAYNRKQRQDADLQSAKQNTSALVGILGEAAEVIAGSNAAANWIKAGTEALDAVLSIPNAIEVARHAVNAGLAGMTATQQDSRAGKHRSKGPLGLASGGHGGGGGHVGAGASGMNGLGSSGGGGAPTYVYHLNIMSPSLSNDRAIAHQVVDAIVHAHDTGKAIPYHVIQERGT